jgi:hypothetical protein
MPIEYEVSSLDSVEESLRGAYVEEGGKFKLDVDKYVEIRNAPLLAKNKQLLDEKKKLDQTLKSSQPAEERAAALERELTHYKLTTPLKDIALKAGVFPDSVDLVMLDTAKRFALGDDGQIQVLDEHGNPTSITPQKFFDTLYKEQRPRFYAASGAGGSGARNDGKGSGGHRTLSRAAFEALDHDERARFFSDGGKLTN